MRNNNFLKVLLTLVAFVVLMPPLAAKNTHDTKIEEPETSLEPVMLSIPIVGNTFSILLERAMPADAGDGFICTASIELAALIAGETISGQVNGVQDCIKDEI